MRDLEMAFLAKITASMTHEIANTLARLAISSPPAVEGVVMTISAAVSARQEI